MRLILAPLSILALLLGQGIARAQDAGDLSVLSVQVRALGAEVAQMRSALTELEYQQGEAQVSIANLRLRILELEQPMPAVVDATATPSGHEGGGAVVRGHIDNPAPGVGVSPSLLPPFALVSVRRINGVIEAWVLQAGKARVVGEGQTIEGFTLSGIDMDQQTARFTHGSSVIDLGIGIEQ